MQLRPKVANIVATDRCREEKRMNTSAQAQYSEAETGAFECLQAGLRRLCERDGPAEADYPALDALIRVGHRHLLEGELSRDDVDSILTGLGDAFSVGTLQGMALRKPHGYAGDFEMIEKIYANCVSPDPALQKWDLYFHHQAAPKAVRNRKVYFTQLLEALPPGSRVLNLGVGPGRDMHDYFRSCPSPDVHIECIDVDRHAIDYAKAVNASYADHLTFHQTNIFRYAPNSTSKYDLIWAAGLFDYFDDATFVALGRRFLPHLEPHGKMVIGNFSTSNPTRAYMELIGNWCLRHRTTEELKLLAVAMGANEERVRVESEPEGVNLFLHLDGPCR
jgi:SAM-dependent methyltransferase